MQRRYDTVQEASRILGKTIKKVEQYVNQGILTVDTEGMIPHVEVVEVREAMDSARTLADRTEVLAETLVRLDRVERMLAGILKASGYPAGAGFHHVGDRELYTIYSQSMDALARTEWGLNEVLRWAGILIQLTEIDLHRLMEITGNPHPWKVFASLCACMIVWIRGHDLTSAEMSEAAFLLQKGRKSLIRTAEIFINICDRSPERMVNRYFMEQPIDRLVKGYLPKRFTSRDPAKSDRSVPSPSRTFP